MLLCVLFSALRRFCCGLTRASSILAWTSIGFLLFTLFTYIMMYRQKIQYPTSLTFCLLIAILILEVFLVIVRPCFHASFRVCSVICSRPS